jgi:outer membrane receptor protein involved in Fe transport
MFKKMTKKTLFSLLAVLFLINASAQVERCRITGTVTSSEGETLPGVSVYISGAEKNGTATNNNGGYTLETVSGKHLLIFRQIGFKQVNKEIDIAPGISLKLDVALEPESMQLETFVTTAGKFEQNIERVTLSLEVLKPQLIENKNTTTIETAMQQVPGVSIVDSEPQIRSGSGYSFGAGSRVMILVDDLPLLSGDAGRPSWGFVPVENIEQIEVIKGASSVLYGSAALSGVINIRTAYPREKPQTKISTFSGLYNNPENKEAIYWGDNNPTYSGLNFFHSRQIGNLDLVIGGNFFNDNGYKGPSPVDVTDTTFNPFSEQRGEFENRARMNMNLRYRSKKVEGLSFGVNLNGMYSRSAGTLIWYNAKEGMYRSYPGSNTLTLQDVYNIDPFINYLGKKGFRHSLRNRYFHLNNNNDNNQSNKSDLIYNEYQLQKQVDKGVLSGLMLTAGALHSYTFGVSDLYKGNLSDTTGQQAKSENRNIAAYVQLERTFWDRLTLNAGARYEHFSISSPRFSDADSVQETEEGKPVFRAGMNLKVHKASFLRASFGQGYRFPTIAEKYIRTLVGPIQIYPNENLKSESSWSTEVGIKQGFKISGFKGYLDVVYFEQHFEDNIEFNFGQFGTLADNFFGLGFSSLNIGRAKVSGWDVSLAGQGEIGKNQFSVLAGYTYSLPVSKEPNRPYPVIYAGDSLTYATSSSDSSNYILKYRFQELFKADVEWTRGRWTLGFSARYNSFMQNVDKIFEDLDLFLPLLGLPAPGLKTYREENRSGTWVFDSRLIYKASDKVSMGFVVNNILNKEYALRPMAVEQPRTTALQLTVSF